MSILINISTHICILQKAPRLRNLQLSYRQRTEKIVISSLHVYVYKKADVYDQYK